MAEQSYKVMGINDDEDYCSCCGKEGLKRVVWIAPMDTDGNVEGEAAPYGTTCAAYMLKIAPEKGVRATASIERKIETQLLETVNARIQEIRAGWKQFDSGKGIMLVPPSMDCTGKTGLEVFKQRNAAFPILGYLSGELTLQQAARLL